MYKIETKKDKIKLVRSLLELVFVVALGLVVVHALTVNEVYQPYDAKDPSVVSGQDHGFIAVSYFGVDRQGTSSLISVQQLDEQLGALHDQGYVTIGQQDILDYYENGVSLPDRALFLMFEDGRRDTALFAGKLLEKYDYKATILGYADKFEIDDPKFLSASDLLDLESTGYWELGSNGYRLSYINCFDRYERFLGQMTSEEFVRVHDCLGRDYNHYLMDYIRDEDRIPTESIHQMKVRVNQEYDLMDTVYMEQLGKVPRLYCLMHSNTGRFGDVDTVSEINYENIQALFSMNFNREGYALNTRESSVYDLTRIQPQPDWTVNHLLTRIRDDIEGQGIRMVAGEDSADWELVSGSAEFKSDKILLTTQAKGEGRMILRGKDVKDFHVTLCLEGLLSHTQSILLRADENCENGILIALTDEKLSVSELSDGTLHPLGQTDLHDLVPLEQRVSIEEDRRNTLAEELNMRGRFAQSSADSLLFYAAAKKEMARNVPSVKEGAKEYGEATNALAKERSFEIVLVDRLLSISVNGTPVVEDLEVSYVESGSVGLISSWDNWVFGKRNIADDVYDGVYRAVVVEGDGEVLFDHSLHGVAKVQNWLLEHFNSLVNWFIVNL